MSVRSVLVPGVFVGLTAWALGGCSDGGSNRPHLNSDRNTSNPGATGQLTVFAVDAPPRLGDLREVRVRIERLEAIGRSDVAVVGSGVSLLDASTMPITTSTTPGQPIAVTLLDTSRELELLSLRGGRREQLAQRQVPAGTYEAVRLILSAPSVALAPPGGVPRIFDQPSGDLAFISSEVVVPLSAPVVVTAGQQAAVLLDFDLARSLAVTQGTVESPTRLSFDPVIRGGPLEPGRILGVVTSDNYTPGLLADDVPVAGALVSVAHSQFQVVGSTLTDAAGGYVISSVPPGQYLLMIEQPGHQTLVQPIVVTSADQQLVVDGLVTGLVRGAVVGIQTK